MNQSSEANKFYNIILVLTIILFIAAGCVQPLEPEGGGGNNAPPVINSFFSDKSAVAVGNTAVLTVEASDPNGDKLSYEWFVLLGDIIGDGPQVLYSAAYCCAGVNKITVTVKDSKGASIKKSLKISVY